MLIMAIWIFLRFLRFTVLQFFIKVFLVWLYKNECRFLKFERFLFWFFFSFLQIAFSPTISSTV